MERRETEFKLLLSGPQDVAVLRAALPHAADATARVSHQLNHFFETPRAALSAAECGLRLRLEDRAWTLTAKGPARSGDRDPALSDRAEEECPVDAVVAARILEGDACPLVALLAHAPAAELLLGIRAAVGDETIRHVGSFENERTRVGPVTLELDGAPTEVVFEFDRTQFPGGRLDTEVEVEVPEPRAEAAGRLLRALFDQVGIPWRPAPTKAARFFECLRSEA